MKQIHEQLKLCGSGKVAKIKFGRTYVNLSSSDRKYTFNHNYDEL